MNVIVILKDPSTADLQLHITSSKQLVDFFIAVGHDIDRMEEEMEEELPYQITVEIQP